MFRSLSRTPILLAGVAALAVGGFVFGATRARKAEGLHPPVGDFVQVDGVRLHYRQAGEGQDVILIHGALMQMDEPWAALGDALAARGRVTAFDRPNHGFSHGPMYASPERQAAAIHAAAVELGLQRPVIVGHSLGGAVALAYGALYPDDTAGVVAVSPMAYPGWGPGHLQRGIRAIPLLGPLLSRTLLAWTDPLLVRAGVKFIFSPQKTPAGFSKVVGLDLLARPRAMTADGADFILASASLQGLSKSWAAYPVPLHVVVGGKDRVLQPERQGERLAKAVPDAALTVRAELGHMLHWFAPEAVVEAVHEVLARVSDSPVPVTSAGRDYAVAP